MTLPKHEVEILEQHRASEFYQGRSTGVDFISVLWFLDNLTANQLPQRYRRMIAQAEAKKNAAINLRKQNKLVSYDKLKWQATQERRQ